MTVVFDPTYAQPALRLPGETVGHVRSLLADLLPNRSMSAREGSDHK